MLISFKYHNVIEVLKWGTVYKNGSNWKCLIKHYPCVTSIPVNTLSIINMYLYVFSLYIIKLDYYRYSFTELKSQSWKLIPGHRLLDNENCDAHRVNQDRTGL